MDIYPQDETSHTTQYAEVILKYGKNEFCGKHWQMSIIEREKVVASNIFGSAKASGFGELSYDQYDLSSDNEEY